MKNKFNRSAASSDIAINRKVIGDDDDGDDDVDDDDVDVNGDVDDVLVLKHEPILPL